MCCNDGCAPFFAIAKATGVNTHKGRVQLRGVCYMVHAAYREIVADLQAALYASDRARKVALLQQGLLMMQHAKCNKQH